MSAETREETEGLPRKLSPAEKRAENIIRIKRSVIACLLGIITGFISYLLVDPSDIMGLQSYTMLALLIMFAGIVIQKHIFVMMRLNPLSMGTKDWIFQGFMTFAFWFIVWTILLTSKLQ